MEKSAKLIGIVMGSNSDWKTLKHTSEILTFLNIEHETEIVSAHRTPNKLFEYAEKAKSRQIEIIIAGAGGAAHLPGMLAAKTALPIIGVPIQSQALNGIDSLLSIVQMPAGIPVATMAIGIPGARNAGLFAAAILANKYHHIAIALDAYRDNQTQLVLDNPNPTEALS
jgi:5-(carboxyamino)imidazole ribonucleotide mutase